MPALLPGSDARTELLDDGVTVLRGVIAPASIDQLRLGVDRALACPTPLGQQLARTGGAFHSDLYLSASFPIFHDFARDSPIAGLVGELLGLERVVLFTDELLVKEPGTALETPWHHDGSYWPVAGDTLYSAWIPLDAVSAATGALHFIRGSHRDGRRYHPRDFATSAERVTSPDEVSLTEGAPERDPRSTLIAEVEPGDCVLFHALTLHRATGNLRAETRRRAIVLRLAGPDVRYDPRPRTLPLIWAPRLAPGDPLGGELFPTLWRRNPESHA